jgi:hypothetical protein
MDTELVIQAQRGDEEAFASLAVGSPNAARHCRMS